MENKSPYALQLENGFRLLRFSGALEAEYRCSHLGSVRTRIVICLTIMVVFSIWASIVNRGGGAVVETPALIDHLRVWVMRPLSVYLIVSTLVAPLYYRGWLLATPVILTVSGALGGFSVAGLVVGGNEHAFVAMLSGFLGVYLLMGLLFWHATALGTLIGSAYICSLLYHEATASTLYFESVVLAVVTCTALIFIYTLERSQRESFLQKRILRDLGRHDSLTGLKNRRVFDESLVALWQQGLRDRKPIGMLIVDVDYFKRFNDCYGHQAGDRCLIDVAAVLRGVERRPLNVPARIGGEEFALLFYAPSPSHISATANAIIADVTALAIPHEHSDVASVVSVSIGAAMVQPRLGRTPASLQQFVDEALYQAKQSGRNRLVWREEGYDEMVTGAFQIDRRD